MARLRRIDAAGVTQHVIQRGNNRQACFVHHSDREAYLDALGQALDTYSCALHAYVLMTNHVHLLITPTEVGGVASVMQSLGRRYVRYFNITHKRTGTLWEGRYKSSLVDSERYVLSCYRYIELNPVRARMVLTAAEYEWSSYRCNAMGQAEALVTPHPSYFALGNTKQTRRRAYRGLFEQAIPEEEIADIRHHSNQGKAWGSDEFKAKLEEQLGRNVCFRGVGRPKNVL